MTSQGTSPERSVGLARNLQCHVAATATKKPKTIICSTRPPRISVSPRWNPDAVVAPASRPAPPPWMRLCVLASYMHVPTCPCIRTEKEGGFWGDRTNTRHRPRQTTSSTTSLAPAHTQLNPCAESGAREPCRWRLRRGWAQAG